MKFAVPRLYDPEQPPQWPLHFVVDRPARWPAKNWRLRRRLAAPLRQLARGCRSLVAWALRPLDRLATVVEGQPYGFVTTQPGWKQFYRSRELRWTWVYEGPITPAIRRMFAEHPERFADCAPALLYSLRTGR